MGRLNAIRILTKAKPQPSEQAAKVVSGGGEDGVDKSESSPCESQQQRRAQRFFGQAVRCRRRHQPRRPPQAKTGHRFPSSRTCGPSDNGKPPPGARAEKH
jgi:hypothetical protein